MSVIVRKISRKLWGEKEEKEYSGVGQDVASLYISRSVDFERRQEKLDQLYELLEKQYSGKDPVKKLDRTDSKIDAVSKGMQRSVFPYFRPLDNTLYTEYIRYWNGAVAASKHVLRVTKTDIKRLMKDGSPVIDVDNYADRAVNFVEHELFSRAKTIMAIPYSGRDVSPEIIYSQQVMQGSRGGVKVVDKYED